MVYVMVYYGICSYGIRKYIVVNRDLIGIVCEWAFDHPKNLDIFTGTYIYMFIEELFMF
jgi:hypothetical protein